MIYHSLKTDQYFRRYDESKWEKNGLLKKKVWVRINDVMSYGDGSKLFVVVFSLYYKQPHGISVVTRGLDAKDFVNF